MTTPIWRAIIFIEEFVVIVVAHRRSIFLYLSY